VNELVYTWVDGAAEGYGELCRRYTSRPQDLNPERYRDPYQLLRYSLRSVERFVPWIERVLLFTCRPQVPDWLSSEVTVVHHDEIIDSRFLPTFSPNVIESYLHLLPLQSPVFLYANDDFFFGAPVAREDFLTPGGRLRVYGTLMGEQLAWRIRDRTQVPSFGFLEHTPYPIHRELWGKMLEHYARDVEATRRNRFRCSEDVRMDRLWRYFLLSQHRARCSVVSGWEVVRGAAFLKLHNDAPRLERQLANVGKRFLCLNDDQGPSPAPSAQAVVREFLERSYPWPSRWEKRPAIGLESGGS
jgi:hypothetical protein